MTVDPTEQRRRGHVPDVLEAIDERAAEMDRQRRRGDILERSRYATATTTGAGGAGGGSPPSDPPDQAGIDSLRKDNAGTERAGAIVLEDSDLTTITDKVADGGTDRAFDFSSVSLLLVGSLPGTGTAGILYHRTSDDTLHYDTGADGSWVQLALTSDVPTALWSKTGTDLSPATAGDDVLLNAGEILQLVESSDTVTLSAWITGDSFPRFNLTAGGTLSFGDGSGATDVTLGRRSGEEALDLVDQLYLSKKLCLFTAESSPFAVLGVRDTGSDTFDRFRILKSGALEWGSGSSNPDISLTRIAASVLGLATGDAFRAPAYVEMKNDAVGTPAGVDSGYTRYGVNASRRAYTIDEDDNVQDLAVTTQHWYVGQGEDGDDDVNVAWKQGAMPGSSLPAPAITATSQVSLTLPASAGGAPSGPFYAYGHWIWTSVLHNPEPLICDQSQFTVVCPVHRVTSNNTAKAYVRLRVNDPNLFDSIKLYIADEDGSPISSATSITPTTSFADYATGEIDLSSHDDAAAAVVLCVQGAVSAEAGDYGGVEVDIVYFGLDRWTK